MGGVAWARAPYREARNRDGHEEGEQGKPRHFLTHFWLKEASERCRGLGGSGLGGGAGASGTRARAVVTAAGSLAQAAGTACSTHARRTGRTRCTACELARPAHVVLRCRAACWEKGWGKEGSVFESRGGLAHARRSRSLSATCVARAGAYVARGPWPVRVGQWSAQSSAPVSELSPRL